MTAEPATATATARVRLFAEPWPADGRGEHRHAGYGRTAETPDRPARFAVSGLLALTDGTGP